MSNEETGYDFGDHLGVPDGEGTPAGEATIYDGATHAREDLSCPNDCFELEVTAHHEAGGAEDLIDQHVQDDFESCPNCGANLNREANDA